MHKDTGYRVHLPRLVNREPDALLVSIQEEEAEPQELHFELSFLSDSHSLAMGDLEMKEADK